MSRHYEMITVGGEYQSLIGGANTVRKFSEKYAGLQPGDTVRMVYCESAENQTPIAEERLTVSAVAIGPFVEIIETHWSRNHAEPFEPADLVDVLEHAYGKTADSDTFIAIYFA